jgi:hypothetical protein
MESGSVTTLVITASAGISSSGAIISPSFTGSLSGSALEAISASFTQTASYVLNAVSASFTQTASYVLNAVSASLAQTASFIDDSAKFPFSGSAVITGSLVISSSNQEQSLQLYGSGSTIFSIEGSRGTLFSIDDDESDGILFSANNVSGTPVLEVHEDNTVKLGKQNGFGIIISGSNPLPNDVDAKILITGSIYHSGSNAYFNAPLTASSFSAPAGVINQLTASYAISASVEVTKEISSSHADTADTASYVENAQTASFVTTAQTASYVLNAISSSYALSASFSQTASYIKNAQTASFITTAQTASFVILAQTASFVQNAISSSYALSASYAVSSSHEIIKEVSSSHADTADTASYVETAQTASYVLNSVSSSYALSASYSDTASFALNVTTPTLQQVTTAGQTTSGSIIITNDSGNNKSWLGTTGVDKDGFLALYTGSGVNVYLRPGTSYINANLHLGGSGNITNQLQVTGDALITSNLTASANISASGFISASEFIGLVTTAQTASYVENAQTASFVTTAQTASYVTLAQTASYVETAQTASFVTTAQTASFVTTAQTASYIAASNIDGTITSASYALTASYAVSASHEIIKEVSSSYANTASFAQSGNGIFSGSFSGSFEGNGSGLTNIPASGITGLNLSRISSGSVTASIAPNKGFEVNTNITASGNISASGLIEGNNLKAKNLTNTEVIFAGTDGNLTSDSAFTYNTTTERLTVPNLTTVSFTASFITSSTIETSGSNIFGDEAGVDIQTLVGTTKMTGSAQVTGSLNISENLIVSTGSFNRLEVSDNSRLQGDLRVDDNVGIGTTAGEDGAKLNVRGTAAFSADAYGRIEIIPVTGGGQTAVIKQTMDAPRNGGNLQIQADKYVQGGNLYFATNGNNKRMTINASGNVGIGTTATTQKLQVAGNISASGYVSASSFVNTTPGTINELTASYAVTASHALNVATPTLQIVTDAGSITTTAITGSNISASGFISASEFIGLVTTAQTASYVETAQTASYVLNAQTASFVTTAQTASYVETAQTASYVLNAISSSYALSASLAQTASFITLAQTSSYVLASNIDQPFTNITASGNISASGLIEGNNLKAKNLTNTEVIFAGTDGNLTSDSAFTYNTTTERLTVPNLTTVSFTASFITSSTIETSGSNIFGDDTTDTQTLIGTTKMSGSAQITGSSTLIDGNFTINGGGYFDNKNSSGAQVSRIGQAGTNGGEMILSNNAGTAKIALTPTTANFKTNITASGNISASGYISASEFVGLITTAQTASYILASNIDQPFTNITASGNISASGKFIGTELSSHSDLIFDVDGADILLKDDGTEFGRFKRDTSDFVIKSAENNKDIVFRGQDEGSTITALTLDMSEAGSANFNNHITASGNISASGDVITQQIGIINGAGIGFGANFPSGNEDADVEIFTDSAGEINFVKNNTTVLAILGGNEIFINPSYALREPLKVTNSITASGAISASEHISASSFNATPSIVNQLTASYAMTASSVDPPVNYKPIVTHTSNFNSDLTYAGRYNIVGGTLAVTVTTGSTPTNLEPGMEWDFFQTSSGDSFTFTQGTGVEIISRNSNKRLAAVGSAGTLKYISGQTFHLIGDLTI